MQLRNTAPFIRYAHACRTRYVCLSTEQWVLFHPTGTQANADWTKTVILPPVYPVCHVLLYVMLIKIYQIRD